MNPQFSLTVVHDPYGCALTVDPATGRPLVSVYRRPLPSTNLRFLTAVMFDGRETAMPLNNPQTFAANLSADLTHQAISAVETGQAPGAEVLNEIVRFEMGLSTAQIHDDDAKALYGHGASGGPLALSAQPFYPGMNDALGGDPTGRRGMIQCLQTSGRDRCRVAFDQTGSLSRVGLRMGEPNQIDVSSSLSQLLFPIDWTEHFAQFPSSPRVPSFQVASWREPS